MWSTKVAVHRVLGPELYYSSALQGTELRWPTSSKPSDLLLLLHALFIHLQPAGQTW